MGSLLTNLVLAAFLSAGFGALLRRPALRLGLVDRPCDRKNHHGEVPLVGGIGVISAFLLVWAAGAQLWYWPPVIAALVFLALGLADDVFDLRPLWRLLLQLLVAAWLVAAAGLVLPDLGQLAVAFPIRMEWAAFPFAVACLVALTNAINMVGGHDGVAGGLVLGALFWLVVAASLAGNQELLGVLMVLFGFSLGGFGMIGWWLGLSELALFGVFLVFSVGYLALMEWGMSFWMRSREGVDGL